MNDSRPGLNPQRLLTLMQKAIQRCELDLHDMVVLTEAATGAYVVTPVLAAMAEAKKVFALTHHTRYGTIEQGEQETMQLADTIGVSERIEVITKKSKDIVAKADIVTNSGHVRPIDAEMVGWMKPTAVIPLMYESWEFRHTDLCLKTCQERGIPVAGTNERHPKIGVFEYLGPMVAKALFNTGLEIYGNSILLICDNDFSSYIEQTLKSIGANVLRTLCSTNEEVDAIVFAHTPSKSGGSLGLHSLNLPNKVPVCCQVWGDVDRSYFETKWIPEKEPKAGHMGIKLSTLGVEAVVRLQAGGLKVGQLLANGMRQQKPVNEVLEIAVQSGYAQYL